MIGRDVFINCPFTDDYQANFQTIVFTVIRSGFTPRCARESDDGGEVRFEKICRIIRECPYSVHDISRPNSTQTRDCRVSICRSNSDSFSGRSGLVGSLGRKKTLIFDRDPYRYQSYISDIAGQDIHPHKGDVDALIRELAAWLRNEVRDPRVPGGFAIAAEFEKFRDDLPAIAGDMQLQVSELTFNDLVEVIARWIPKAP